MARRGGEQQQVRPGFLIAAGVAGVAVIGFLLVNFVFGGDSGEPEIPDVTPRPQADGDAMAAPEEPEATPTPSPDEIEVFEIFEGRDPFRPLVFERPEAPEPPPGEEATPPPDGGPVVTPAPTPPPPRSGVQVEVLSVADDSSSTTVRVGSEVFENATEGQTLDSGVVVVGIEDPCVDFRRGDRSFTLCEGEQVLK